MINNVHRGEGGTEIIRQLLMIYNFGKYQDEFKDRNRPINIFLHGSTQYPQQHELNMLFCSQQYGLTNGKYFIDVDTFRTQNGRWNNKD
jgi:hypothetical protein